MVFADQEGKVAEIDMEHKKAKVMIEMFGRMTPVEVDFDSVQRHNWALLVGDDTVITTHFSEV